MKLRNIASGMLALAIIVFAFCGNPTVEAGDWHIPSRLICSECHTMHYSEYGAVPIEWGGGGPHPGLLKKAADALCLMCHENDPNIPDVMNPGYAAAAGFFDAASVGSSDCAHNLGASPAETPPGGTVAMSLSCISCHAPHGSNNYRNLLLNPPGAGSMDVSVVAVQENRADGDGPDGVHAPDQVYIPTNIDYVRNTSYVNGIGQWCNDCHNNYHGQTQSETGIGPPTPWLRHPQDVTISGSTYVNYDYWSDALVDRIPMGERIEVQNQFTDSQSPFAIPQLPATYGDDEVFCLSCHKAHGSANRDSLIYADGNGTLSTCQQCHYQ